MIYLSIHINCTLLSYSIILETSLTRTLTTRSYSVTVLAVKVAFSSIGWQRVKMSQDKSSLIKQVIMGVQQKEKIQLYHSQMVDVFPRFRLQEKKFSWFKWQQ